MIAQHPSVEVSHDGVEGGDGPTPIWRYRPTRPTRPAGPTRPTGPEGTQPGSASGSASGSGSGSGPEAPTFLWVHGGGFFRGDLTLPEAHRVSLAIAARGIPVVSADYRLVPPPGFGWARRPGSSSVRFPLPMEDVLKVIRHVSRESGSRFFVGGASAGASLVSSALLEASADGVTPLGAVLAYGFFHARIPEVPEIQRLVRGHRRVTHSRWALDLTNRNYAGTAEALTDPRAFAGGNDLRGFPPTLMMDAERDSMRASGDQFARELIDADVELDRYVLTGAEHAFLNRPDHKQFDFAIDVMVEWMTRAAARGL